MITSIAGGHTNQYTNPSCLAWLTMGTMIISIADGLMNRPTNLSYFEGTVNAISGSDYKVAEQSCTEDISYLSYLENIANAYDLYSFSKLLCPLYHTQY